MAKYGPKPRPVEERFWEKVLIRAEEDCWEWMGYCLTVGMGYGRFGPTRRSIQYAHRVAWELECGPIPDDMCVLHTCDTPSCCNPSHLWLGTKKDNTHDMMMKGRAKFRGNRVSTHA